MQAEDAARKQQKPNERSIDFWATCVKAEVFSFQTRQEIERSSSHGNCVGEDAGARPGGCWGSSGCWPRDFTQT